MIIVSKKARDGGVETAVLISEANYDGISSTEHRLEPPEKKQHH